MKIRRHKPSALSLVEVLVIVATLAFLATLLLPASSKGNSKRKALRISCVNNLKQVGLALRIYWSDHEERFPWMVPTDFNSPSTSGSQAFTNSPDVFPHFQVASNEINSPKILVCPADKQRHRATNFAALSNRNLSYFVGLDAEPTNPQAMLSGDRNITGRTFVNPDLLMVRANDLLAFTKDMHESQGNVGLADGSVQQVNARRLNEQVAAALEMSSKANAPRINQTADSVTNASFRLAIP